MNDLERSIGRIEGTQDAMSKRLDDFDRILREIKTDLAQIKAAEAKRAGERGVMLWLAGIIGGASAVLAKTLATKFFG